MKRPGKKKRRVRVGVDTGGTFTDFVFQTEDGSTRVFKTASTPVDPSEAITEGLRRISRLTGASLREMDVIHGTTVGTNALLERRGAKTALVTTAGFEDVLIIGRQARPSLYDLFATRPAPLVPDELRIGVRERVAANGEVLEELRESALQLLVRKLKRARVDSIAVCLLFSFVRPEHELRIMKALATLNVPLSVSHRILPEYREYERTSTVIVNAYLQPLMGAYLNRLKAHAPRLRVMQSSGGAISADVAATEPVRTILSGPAGGVVGALRLARRGGVANIITFDMGGTSTDVALCDAQGMRMTREAHVDGMPVAVTMMDIQTVGAGGGSIARVDEGGSLRVGPESAGATPGPACYGRGKLPTVTDANLVLGRFGGAGLLGGEFQLDEGRARAALKRLAREMSEAAGRRIGVTMCALGILRVVNTNMERALRSISVERGYDPREFALVPFGGAGGLHAVELARALRLPRVIAPKAPGALSALGALISDVVKDWSRTLMLDAVKETGAKLERVFREMEEEARAALNREGFKNARQRHERSLGVRYQGQSFELEISWSKGKDLSEAFHSAHLARYGYAQAKNRVEIVSARLRAIGVVEQLSEEQQPRPAERASGKRIMCEPRERRMVQFAEGPLTPTGIYVRDELKAGARLRSPCIVTEYSATTLVPPGASAFVDELGNLIIEP
ncbi:MAG TPA: hydantoinase/oxoprolinase family protein [Pyrinomonadaceae bacterium]|nr:hydantoinase/oxoprolinase family protein [Pyrinomonadaceae bacterium]